MIMMPVFTNVFQIYSMCNLHDVSWGNRPAGTGQEAFTADKSDQAKSEADYKVYRTKFLLKWLAANLGFYMLIVEFLTKKTESAIRDGDSGILEIFSMYLGALVVFRVVFAAIYILMWKFRYNFMEKYKVSKRNLLVDFSAIKKKCKNGLSSDDEEIEEELEKI